jgi:hypothetical protein
VLVLVPGGAYAEDGATSVPSLTCDVLAASADRVV